jgi:aminoglycoside phosphotransferase (APT) family kinase protein
MGEQRLPGGFVTPVVRAGDTVRRQPPEDREFVHALLGWFERHGWGGAPRFHDLTAGTALAGDAEVVCHNDLSPKNTVYRDVGAGLRPTTFIDWDTAAPGKRIHDVAHVCWQYVGLGPGLPDADAAGRRIGVICDAYGLADRDGLLEKILWWQDRSWRGIEDRAAAGDFAMIRLRESGAARSVRDAFDWVAAHRDELAAHVR